MSFVLAIDLDGTIRGPKGEPIDGAQEGMHSLFARGHTLLVHTARPVHLPDVKNHVAEWLQNHAIPYDDIVHHKPEAAVYLDDRALRFTSWPQAIEDIASLRFRTVHR